MPKGGELGYFLSGDANADRYLVNRAPDMARLKFAMDFAIPERMSSETGPITLATWIDGQVLDRVCWKKVGEQQCAQEVPAGIVRPSAIHAVAIDPEPARVSEAGFTRSRAGFVE